MIRKNGYLKIVKEILFGGINIGGIYQGLEKPT